MKTADRIAAVVLLGLSVLFYGLSLTFSPFSALFPRTVVVILGGLSLLLLILSFVRPPEGTVFEGLRSRTLPVLTSAGLMVAWLALINVLGFLVTSLLCFAGMTVFLDRDARGGTIALRVLAVVALTVGFYLFFAGLLMVPFPMGVLI